MRAFAETTADPAMAAEYRALAAKWLRLAIETQRELISDGINEPPQGD